MCKHIFTPIAHRGGTEAAFENTYEAFSDAYALGYRWFETDVQISKDGVLYAMHDYNLKRVVGININIDQLNSEDLDQILINGKHRIPRIDLLLRKFHDVTFNIDAKNINAAKALVNLLNSNKSFQNLCLGSFSYTTINYMRKFLKRDLPMSFSQWEVFSLILGIKFDKDTKYNASYLQIPKSYLGYKLISKKLLDYCKKNGIKVHVWTINEKNEMKKLIGMGVDGIMTDKCRILLDVARKYKFVEKKIVLDPFSIT
jgi:glycerophosphoryl diester phosphodiesterase